MKTMPPNRYDVRELGGAFGDLGTLIPFLVAYVSVLKVDPTGILLAFGATMVATGFYYRTPFPVQPMKAIGAAAITQSAGSVALTPAILSGAGLVTAIVWLALGVTGFAARIASLIPGPALIGVVMGLGFGFMLEGLRSMAHEPLFAAVLLFLAMTLLARSRFPTMLVLLAVGALVALMEQPALLNALAIVKPHLRPPPMAWSTLSLNDVTLGALLLALPQLPLTFGNALLAITEENNRLFPQRPVTPREVALSTGLMNLFSSAIGGVPICHGAGGMAGHVRFGARTGGAAVMLGALLIVLALFFGDSLLTLLRLFPPAVLGVILFLAGAELALGARDPGPEKADRYVVLTTAAVAMWHVGIAVIFGILFYHAARRGWFRH